METGQRGLWEHITTEDKAYQINVSSLATKKCIYLWELVTNRYTFRNFINALTAPFLAPYFFRSRTVTLSTCGVCLILFTFLQTLRQCGLLLFLGINFYNDLNKIAVDSLSSSTTNFTIFKKQD